MTFEIHADKHGKPYLKKVDRHRVISVEGRGKWVEIGRSGEAGMERLVAMNKRNGYVVLPDEDGVYRILVLTE